MAEDLLAVLLLLFGLGCWLFTPVFERLASDVGASSALGAGAAAITLALISAWTDGDGVVAVLAMLLLAWAVAVYVGYRASCTPLPAPPVADGPAGTGLPLTLGDKTRWTTNLQTWRTHLIPAFVCRPSDGGLSQSAWASGGAFYGLYFATGQVGVTPHVEVVWDSRVHPHEGQTAASSTGDIEQTQSPVRVYVKNVIISDGDTVTVITKMGAALHASGGPNIDVSGGPVGISMSFPQASLSAVTAMGTYRWQADHAD